MARARKDQTAWRSSPEGSAKYIAARKEAQQRANELGFDHGLEANDVFKSWHVFMLPSRANRCGFELRCEVVMCENLDKCQPGHGPG
jgi:hypothetical protein